MRKLMTLAALAAASTCQAAQYVDVPRKPVYSEISDPVQPVRSIDAVVVQIVNQVCKDGKCGPQQQQFAPSPKQDPPYIQGCENGRCGQSTIQGIVPTQITRSPVVQSTPNSSMNYVPSYSLPYVPRVTVGGMRSGSIVEGHLRAEHGVANPPNGIEAWKLHDQLHAATPARTTTYNRPVRRLRLFRK